MSFDVKRIWSNPNWKNGALYTLFSFANNGISFILILILAKYLLPSDYGYLNLYNSFVQIISILIALGTTSYVSNAFFQKNRTELSQVILTSILTIIVCLIVFTIILLGFPIISSRLVGLPLPYLLVALIICGFQCITNLNLDIWRLEEKPISYGLFSMSMVILNFIVTLVWVVWENYGWVGRIYAQGTVASIFFLISGIFLCKRGYLRKLKISKSIVWETLIFGIPLVPHMLSFWLKQGMDRYIINYYFSSTDVGIYSFALNYGSIIGIIGTAFNANNSVFMYKSLTKGYYQARKSLNHIAKLMFFIFLACSVIVWIGSYELIPYVLPKYTNSKPLLFPICCGAFFQCLYLLFVNYLFFYKKTQQLMYITFTTAIIQCILSLILTKYSILWTAYISMSVSLLTTLSVYYLSKKTCNSVLQ